MYETDEAVEKINTWHEEASKVGLEEIRAELIAQIQASVCRRRPPRHTLFSLFYPAGKMKHI